MTIEIIRGTLNPAQAKSRKWGYARFPALRINTPSGVREVKNVATGQPVTAEVTAGGEGDWYITTADGALGLFGVRRPDGRAVYAHYSNVESMMLVVGILGTIAGIARWGFGYEEVPVTPGVLGPLLLAGYAWLDARRRACRRAFAAGTVG